MFEFIRTHNKAIQILLFIFILPGFFLFGIEGFNRMGEKSETVAVVDGQKIGQLDWDVALREDVERIRQNNPNVDPKFFDTPDFRYAALERLVQKRVLAAAAQTLHLGVSDQRLAAELLQNPLLASLRKPDGKVDEARYKELVAQQGLTPAGFEAKVRADLSAQQVSASIVNSGMVPAGVADVTLNAFFEKREVQILNLSPAQFAKQLNPTDAEVEAFYKGNTALFQATEKASVEYVVLDLESIKKTVTLSEADVKKHYDENASRLSGTEERRASHILIEASKSATDADRVKAKARAQELLAQVKKSPSTFAQVAKKNSQDPGSAANGGDLGFFKRESMVKPFADAVFAMAPKQISELVESDYGYHIIQLNEVKVPKQRSFAEVRADIEAELKQQQAQKKFAEVAEVFTNMVYEQSDSLKPVAEKLKLDIHTASDITRQALPGAKGALANAKFLSALFAADAVDKKRNTEAMDIGGNQLVAGRVVNYTPAQTMPFAQVKDRATAMLTARMGVDAARKAGIAKLAEVKALPVDATVPELSPLISLSRDKAQQGIPQKLLDAVMRADASQLPVWIGVDSGEQGYQVIRLSKVVSGEQGLADQNRERYLQMWSSAEAASYYEYLKEKFKAQIKVQKADAKPKSA